MECYRPLVACDAEILRWQDRHASSPATRLENLRYPGKTGWNRAVAQRKCAEFIEN
jgi:hypothetical protein